MHQKHSTYTEGGNNNTAGLHTLQQFRGARVGGAINVTRIIINWNFKALRVTAIITVDGKIIDLSEANGNCYTDLYLYTDKPITHN